MTQMNQIVIEGNVVRDSLVKQTPRGTKVCVVPIATNRYYKDMRGETQKEVAYFDVEAWGENFSSSIVRMAKKGRALRVVGRLKQDRWKTQDGKSSSKVYIVAEHIEVQKPYEKQASNESAEANTQAQAEGIRAETEFPEAESEEFAEESDAVF